MIGAGDKEWAVDLVTDLVTTVLVTEWIIG